MTFAIDGATFLGTQEPVEEETRDWVIQGLVPRRAITFLAGQPKVGKSTIALDLAISAASGQPFLGFPTTRPAKVIVVSEEDRPAVVKRRTWRIARAHGIDEPNRLPISFATQFRFRLDEDEKVKRLVGDIEGGQCDLLILDPLSRMHWADENSSKEMIPIIASLDKFIDAGASVVVVHHHRKASTGDERGGGQLLRGSSVLFAASRAVITIDKVRDVGPMILSAEGNEVCVDPVTFDLEYRVEGSKQSICLEQREVTGGRRKN